LRPEQERQQLRLELDALERAALLVLERVDPPRGDADPEAPRRKGPRRPLERAAVEVERSGALAELGSQDRLILKMRFQDGFQVSRISRLLGLDQKELYRRLERTMKAE
jgi:DNA-directed RNA polymerase specialized sigma subunit